MHVTVLCVLWAIVAFFLYKALDYVVTWRRHTVLAREMGCKPAPYWNVRDPFGLKNVRLLIKADREKRLPDYGVERMETISRREGRTVSTMRTTQAFEDQFFTTDPKNIQALLATQFKDFGLGEPRINNFSVLLGHGIFASDGKKWEHSRALLRPQFVRDQVSDLDLEETHVKNMMRAMPVNADGWTSITDIQVLFFRLTLDSATEFLFGESVDSQLSALPGHNSSKSLAPERDERLFAYAFDRSQWWLAQALRLGTKYWLAHTADFKKQCRDVHAYVDYFVQMALNKELREKELEKGPTGKKKYVFLEALAKETQDPNELRAELLNILLAGRDTTASLLSWLFMLLAQHPAIFQKLRTAILDDFGPYTPDSTNISFTALKNCTYLQHTLNEALRLYPVVPFNSRRAAVDTSLPRGGGPDGTAPVFVSKGTEVTYSVHVMQRRKDLWGADADDFKPERWVGRKGGWEYLPFNGGPRVCIGQQFALTEAGYVVTRLLQRFEALEGFEMGGRIKHGATLTSCPGEGVKVRLREARA